MTFREWINIDEIRFKGFNRMFNSNHPDIHPYIRKQIYTNHIGPDFNRMISQQPQPAQTGINWRQARDIRQKIAQGDELTPDEMNYWQHVQAIKNKQPVAVEALDPRLAQTIAYKPNVGPTPGEILDNELLKKVQWAKKPTVVEVSPLDFDQSTLMKFMLWKFGFRPQDGVRNDAQRFDTQRTLAQSGNNEPIIMIKEGNKFKLVEGFHRAMVALLSAHDDNLGAPRNHIEALKAGYPPHTLDFSQWKRVPLKAYIGQRLA